jgi:hypothetical protein
MTDSRTAATLTICGFGLGLVAIFLSTSPAGAWSAGIPAAALCLGMLGLGWTLLHRTAGASLAANRREEAALEAACSAERQRLRARRFDGGPAHPEAEPHAHAGDRAAA